MPNQSVMAQVSFSNGIMGHFWISSELPPPALPSSEVRFQLVGARGTLDFENYEFLDLGIGDRWERLLTPQRFDYTNEPKSPIRLAPHIGVVQAFVDSIIADQVPSVTGLDGRAAVEICEAMPGLGAHWPGGRAAAVKTARIYSAQTKTFRNERRGSRLFDKLGLTPVAAATPSARRGRGLGVREHYRENTY